MPMVHIQNSRALLGYTYDWADDEDNNNHVVFQKLSCLAVHLL